MTIWAPTLTSEDCSKYEAIALALREDIANGTLKPGQQLPTQRALSKTLSVTVGTIGRAYALAEKQGLISLEIGRGSFVRSFDSRTHQQEHSSDLIDLGLNLPAATERTDLLARTLGQLSNSRATGTLFGCAPVESFQHHREAAAQWLGDRIQCTSDDVVICSGTQNALVSALASVTQPGDKVLVESLTFPGMLAAARFLHLELVPVPMDRYGLIPEELERLSTNIKTLYCIPTNQNPTTITMSENRRRQIARIAERRDLVILEDDVYGKLVENSPAPIAHWAPGRTFLISSLAKTLSVGLRLALVYVPDAYRPKMWAKLRATNFFAAPLLCEIATNWINSDVAEKLLQEQRNLSRTRLQIATDILDPRLVVGHPQCNHLWLRLPDVWNAETIERAAKENGVNVFTSASFAVGRDTPPPAIRVALGAARNESELRVGLAKIAGLLAEHTESHPAQY